MSATTEIRLTEHGDETHESWLLVRANNGVLTQATIGDLACSLLDRGLRDRPGALRLVGVGVSGLADFRQLALETG